MFASDYNRKGLTFSFTFSLAVHVAFLLLFLWITHRNNIKSNMVELTEISMIDLMPDPPKDQPPAEMPKPKTMMDMFKQVIPIKIKPAAPALELSKPKLPDLAKPKLEMNKPQALSMDKMKVDLKPGKVLDIDNEIGRKKLSPAQIEQSKLQLQKQNQIAQAPSQLKLSDAGAKKSFLPMAAPATSLQRKATGIKTAPLAIAKPTPEPKREAPPESINISRGPLLISGQISGRQVLKSFMPKYPRWAEEQGIQAQVAVDLAVTAAGTVKDNARVSMGSGYSELDQLALQAALAFVFAPISSSEDQTGRIIFRYQLNK